MADRTPAPIAGECQSRFAPVRAAFADNFTRRNEIGSAIDVYHQGTKVVDLWGGHMDAARTKPWRPDTLAIMYSLAKSMSALSVHILADEGKVDLEAPVATYWPEFAQAGKDKHKVRHILSHNCGLWPTDAAKAGDVYDWSAMVRVIERQEPVWPAESKGAYNSINIGFMAGEIVRRVTGQKVQDFVRDRICRPLGANYYLGVPEEKLDLCAELSPNPAGQVRAAANDPTSPMARASRAMPVPFDTSEQNSLRFRRSGIPSFAGFGEARGMCRIYAALGNGGEIDGVRIISRAAIERATIMQWADLHEGLLGRPMTMAMGFMRNPPGGFPLFGPWSDAFGHSGSGGARVLTVPSRGLTVCFTSNLQSEQRSIGERTEAIVMAACGCVA